MVMTLTTRPPVLLILILMAAPTLTKTSTDITVVTVDMATAVTVDMATAVTV
jgi:hypothetical protein